MFVLHRSDGGQEDRGKIEMLRADVARYSGTEEVRVVHGARLGFIGAETMHSKFFEDKETLTLIQGQIWDNDKSLTPADLSSYFREGHDGPQSHWSGQYFVLHFNKSDSSVYFFSDPLALQPAFYSCASRGLTVSNRLQWVLDFAPSELNWETVREYLFLGFSLPGDSLYKNIYKIAPSTKLHMTDGGLVTQKYLNEVSLQPAECTMQESAERYFELLKESTGRLLDHYNPQTTYLTGGSDTRVMLACLSEEQKQSLTFCCISDGYWSRDNDDAEVASLLAQQMNLKLDLVSHANKNVFSTPGSVKAMRADGTRAPILSGVLGTESNGGAVFNEFAAELRNRPLEKYSEEIRGFFGEGEYVHASQAYDKFYDQMLSEKGASKEYCYMVKVLWQSELTSFYTRNGTGRFIFSYESILQHKISPFLSDICLAWLMRLPREYLVNYQIYRELFKSKLRRYAEIPFESNITKFASELPRLRVKYKREGVSGFDYARYLHDKLSSEFFKNAPIEINNFEPITDYSWRRAYFARLVDLKILDEGLRRRDKLSKEEIEHYQMSERI